MSTEPEKRSEEWRRRNLAGIHELLADSDFDRIGVLSNDDARFLFDEIRETRAALAASRADTAELRKLVDQQLGECVGCNYNDGPDEYCPHHGRSYNDVLDVAERIIVEARAERDAARVEVSQLRAKIEAVSEVCERYRKAGCTIIGIANVTDALAEPLGSTEDPPATEENR